MKRILITGISGFVGTNLVDYFKSSLDIQLIGHSRDIEKARSRFVDVEFIPELSADNFNRYHVDTIIHLAGIAHDLSGSYQKEDYHRVNFRQTVELYDEFLLSNADRFVFISSIKAITDHSSEIIDENHNRNPASDYGISKRMAEEYIFNHRKTAKNLYILNPVMIHGPGNKGNLNLLYKFVKSGLPYPLAAFDNQRSFLSIDNFCFVINEIIHNRLDQGNYLLSDNDSISTAELVKLIGEVTGTNVRFLKIPKYLAFATARMGSVFKAPFNKNTLAKLVEDMKVSNKKLLLNLGEELPVSTREGLLKTIQSFDE
ncbi:MAG: NAD-dependent epimerase/dehydratase family protein [Cytophagales bacterium]|nr:NAD-dependent epimerase/dehydratase family protein [Cytophagales bacterium]